MSDPVRVLVVGPDLESDPVIETLEREHAGIDVTAAPAVEARDRLDEIECVVCGYELREENALDFIAEARETAPDLPLILYTDRDPDGIVHDALAVGASDYVQRSGTGLAPLLATRIEQAADRNRMRRNMEAELTDVLERVTDAFFALDPDWNFTYLNSRAAELILPDDRSVEDILGNTIWEEYPEAIGTAFEAEYRAAMERQEPTTFEEYYPPLDTWFEVHAYPSETGLSVHFRDVGDRRQMLADLRREEHVRDRIVETSPIGITIVDADGTFSYGNERAEEVLGVSREQLNDRRYDAPMFEVMNVDGSPIPERERPFTRVMETGDRIVGQEIRIRRSDGRDVWLSVNGAPLEDDSGAIDRAVFAFEDITHRKERERELEETVGKLRRSNEKLQRFAYITSHDLQEPLRMVSSFLQLLESRYRDELDEDAVEFIDYAVDGAEHMRDMINDLLEYSRIDTHGDPFEETDANDVLADVRTDLQFEIEETDAELTADDLPTVHADPNQFARLLRNLVSNAIKYRGEERPRIHVSADRDGDRWRFAVADNGIGIDPDHSESVFEVFKRLHANHVYSGTGIGLAVCQKIVERHEGQIWVDSELGSGSTFYFTLPAAPTDNT